VDNSAGRRGVGRVRPGGHRILRERQAEAAAGELLVDDDDDDFDAAGFASLFFGDESAGFGSDELLDVDESAVAFSLAGSVLESPERLSVR
jgi:hypothetical protein